MSLQCLAWQQPLHHCLYGFHNGSWIIYSFKKTSEPIHFWRTWPKQYRPLRVVSRFIAALTPAPSTRQPKTNARGPCGQEYTTLVVFGSVVLFVPSSSSSFTHHMPREWLWNNLVKYAAENLRWCGFYIGRVELSFGAPSATPWPLLRWAILMNGDIAPLRTLQ